MNAAFGILDRNEGDQNTDVILWANFQQKRLVWIPRDLWSDRIRDRVNTAWKRGGGELFRTVLEDLGFPTQRISIVCPADVHAFLEGIKVEVPVKEKLRFYYPLSPLRPIEEGRKIVEFSPPSEILEGERIDQWIGARTRVDGKYEIAPDLDRILRQQIFVRSLIKSHSNKSGIREFFRTVGEICLDWKFQTYDRYTPKTIDGKDVLVPMSDLEALCFVPKEGVELSIIIPSWNNPEWTIRCVQSVRNHTKTSYEIIWIDNGSSRKSHEEVLRELKKKDDFRYEFYDVPLGFPKAINKGISLCSGKYICFLNNDVEVLPDWDTELTFALKTAPGAAGPVAIQPETGWQSTDNHPWLLLPDDANTPERIHRHLRERWTKKRIDVGKRKNSKRWYEMLAFFCVAFNRETVNHAGFLDERFGWGYMEDVEYCNRIRKLGYSLTLCPGALVVHPAGQTTKNLPDKKVWYEKVSAIYRNHVKNEPTKERVEEFKNLPFWCDQVPEKQSENVRKLASDVQEPILPRPLKASFTRLNLLPPFYRNTMIDNLKESQKKFFSTKEPFYLARIGDCENYFLGAGFSTYKKPFAPFEKYLEVSGLDRHALEVRKTFIEALENAHLLGVHQNWFEAGLDTQRFLAMLGFHLPLKNGIEVHLPYYLLYTGKLFEFLKGKKVLLVGGLAYRLWDAWTHRPDFQEGYRKYGLSKDVIISGMVKTSGRGTQAWRNINSYMHEIERHSFDVALVSSGAIAKILAHRIWKTGRTALDVGYVFDALLGTDKHDRNARPILCDIDWPEGSW